MRHIPIVEDKVNPIDRRAAEVAVARRVEPRYELLDIAWMGAKAHDRGVRSEDSVSNVEIFGQAGALKLRTDHISNLIKVIIFDIPLDKYCTSTRRYTSEHYAKSMDSLG